MSFQFKSYYCFTFIAFAALICLRAKLNRERNLKICNKKTVKFRLITKNKEFRKLPSTDSKDGFAATSFGIGWTLQNSPKEFIKFRP